MPPIRLAPSRSIPALRYRSAGAPPAPGSVPSSGVPATSGPAGNIAFTTSILIAFPSATVTPSINRGTFPGLLAYGIGNLVPGATASAADIAIGVAPSTSAADVENVQRAWTVMSDLLSPERGGWVTPSTVSATWVTISGSFNATREWTLSTLNRAIARAFANSVTFPPPAATQLRSRIPAPNDGNPLLATLSQGTACSGFRDYARVYAAACTRWATMRPAPTPVVLPPTPQPVPTPPPPVVQPTLAPALCTTPVRSIFYLRPTATFDHVGPTLPVGTVVDVLEVTPQTRTTFRLYRVRITRTQTVAAARAYIDRVGYAALDAADVAACPSAIVRPSAPSPVPAPVVRPPTHTTPTPTVTPPTSRPPTPVAPVAPTPQPVVRPPTQTTPPPLPVVRQETGGGQGTMMPPQQQPPAAAKSNTPYIVAGVVAVSAVGILLVATLSQGSPTKKRAS